MIRKTLLIYLFCSALLVPAPASLADPPAGTSQDPLVGTRECNNGVFTYDFFFQSNGTLIQQEPTFGNIRNASWTRLSDQKISVAGGPLLAITMDGDSRMSVFDSRVGATWDCTRKQLRC